VKKLSRKQLTAKVKADWAKVDALASAPDCVELCYVEAVGDAYAVKWKQYPETMGEAVTIDTFNDPKQAADYCALMNQMRMDSLRIDALNTAGDLEDAKEEAAADATLDNYGLSECEYASPDGSDPLPTKDLHDVPMLDAGTWRSMSGETVTFTKKDLAELVASFNATKDVLKPFAKLGHIFDEDQRARTGAPSVGRMANLRLTNEGNRIIGSLLNVPLKLARLMEAKSYTRLSPEIFRDFKDAKGKVYRLAFKAVSILGATLPACHTLDDIIVNLFGEGARATAIAPVSTGTVIALSEPIQQEESVMTKDQLIQLATSLGLPATADEATILAAAAALRRAHTESAEQLETAQRTELAAGITTQLTRAKAEGRIMPQQENGLREMVNGWVKDATNDDGRLQTVEFAATVDGNTVTKKGTIVEKFSAFVDQLPVVFKHVTELGSGEQDDNSNLGNGVARDTLRFAAGMLGRQIGFDRGSLERDRRIKAYANKNNLRKADGTIDYCAAYTAVVVEGAV
jgi:hypothetical protein